MLFSKKAPGSLQMPPESGSNGPDGFLNDPRVQVFGQKIAADVLQAIGPMLGQLAAGGRVVEVRRRDAENRVVKQPSTTPQLLAELNDNLVDLIDELRRSNDIAMYDLQLSEDSFEPPRRVRQRRKKAT